mgnify:CR=1 FL=1
MLCTHYKKDLFKKQEFLIVTKCNIFLEDFCEKKCYISLKMTI